MAARHLYLHIPYCAAKCPYCDFNSIAGRDEEHGRYVDAFLRELAGLPRGPYATVFLGGGTPTALEPSQLARLLAGVRAHIGLTTDYEWTCEANPGSSDAEKFALLAEYGVNRISLGVQSTHLHHLRFLGRIHDAAQAHHAIDLACKHVDRVSADLICGLPEQTEAELEADLGLYRQHDLEHASVYHLTIEPGTDFHARHQRGELPTIADEAGAHQLALVRTRLAERGLEPYETSNFARPGKSCRHNLAYWRGRDYAAVGAGAVSTENGVRRTRHKHPAAYIDALERRHDATWRREVLAPAERLAELWMCGLRLQQGVQLRDLCNHGDAESRWLPTAEFLISEGLLERTDTHLRLTNRGRDLQDGITVRLMPDV